MSKIKKTLFEKICDKEIPADIVYEDGQVVAFRDIDPKAPTHLLVIPRKPIPRINEAGPDDQALLGHLLLKAAEVARTLGLGEGGFRLVLNNGRGCWRDGAAPALPHPRRATTGLAPRLKVRPSDRLLSQKKPRPFGGALKTGLVD